MGKTNILQGIYLTRLKALKASNDRMVELNSQKQKLEESLYEINSTIVALKNLSNELDNSYNTYINNLITMIEESIAFAINSVLPFREYKVRLDYTPYRSNGRLKLYLIDHKGRALLPKIIEGDMLNQVLSFASIVHISIQRGMDTVFYDEAFASANIRSLKYINMLITYFVSQGVKFIFVTQNPALYAGMERTMVELQSDGKSVTGVRKTVVGIDPAEFDTVAKVLELYDELTRRDTDGAGD